jgi:hypothetical protein
MAAPNPGAIHSTLCQDCGAELRKPSDLMRHECPIGLAREVRLGKREPLSPSHLHALCRGDGNLFNHAMREAGMIVMKATGKPEDPCSTCGWSPA